jgi:hypothetical protein
MIRRKRILAGVFLGAIALLLLFAFSTQQKIAYYRRCWHQAWRMMAGNSVSMLDRIYEAVARKGHKEWWDDMTRHENALIRLGYLTNAEFRLTNQVITREFYSNFFTLIRHRVGTNDDQVWRCPMLTNRTGYTPAFPAKDYPTWERTFRECASLYASNLPPAAVTAESPRAH